MLTGLNHLHSANRYVVLGFVIVAVIDAVIARSAQKPYSKFSKMMALLALIFSHIQLLVGLVLYFIGDKGISVITTVEGFMSIAPARFFAVEHLVGMLAAIALITVGYSKAKRCEEVGKKYGTVAIFYTVALIIILAMIPWPFLKDFGTWI